MKKRISILLIIVLIMGLILYVSNIAKTEDIANGEAVAIHTIDGTLYFLRTTKDFAVGDKYKNSYVQSVYRGIETTDYNFEDVLVPWNNAKNIKNIVFVNKVSPISMAGWFANMGGLESLSWNKLDTSNVRNMSCMFYNSNAISLDLSHFDTSNVTDMSGMFSSCLRLKELNLSSFDTSNVTNMEKMFAYCRILTKLDLSNFNTSNVTNMNSMFNRCFNIRSIVVSNGWTTDKVQKSNEMFSDCSKLVGGAGTTYNPNATEAIMAHIDINMENPGYLTGITNN